MNKIDMEAWSPEKDQARKELENFEKWEGRKFWLALAFGGTLGVGLILLVVALAWAMSP